MKRPARWRSKPNFNHHKKKERTMNPLTQPKNATILPVFIALMLGCFGLSPQTRAVCQEGFLTNYHTVLGHDALAAITTGLSNTAIGSLALESVTTGNGNTALGAFTLVADTTGEHNTALGLDALEM